MAPTSPTPDRQTYRALVAQVAERAKEKLPQAVNGRVESAVKLVLQGDVELQEDGSITVSSSSDPLKTYRLEGHTCTCQDFERGQVPEGWCQHRIAAGIHKRVQELLPAPAPVEASAEVPATVQATLPEAPASVNVRLTISGRDVQLTLRDTDEARLLARLEEVLQRFPLPQAPAPPASPGQLSAAQHNAAAMHRKVTDFCPIHNVAMQENTKDGRRWFSHYDETAGRWCKGR